MAAHKQHELTNGVYTFIHDRTSEHHLSQNAIFHVPGQRKMFRWQLLRLFAGLKDTARDVEA